VIRGLVGPISEERNLSRAARWRVRAPAASHHASWIDPRSALGHELRMACNANRIARYAQTGSRGALLVFAWLAGFARAHADDIQDAGAAALAHAHTGPVSELAAGQLAYLNARFEDAVRLLAGPLKSGNPDAQFLVGMMFLQGTGEARDVGEALRLLRLAAAQHNASAEDELGNCYISGRAVPADVAQARAWFERGATDGDIDSMYDLANLLLDLGDKDASETWMERAAEGGHPRAQVLYGDSQRFGNGSPTGLRSAAHWYREAALQGDPVGLTRLAEAYDLGIGGLTLDYKTTVKLYQAAADQNYAIGQYKLGEYYEKGYGVTADQTAALKWYRLAAGQGLPGAMLAAADLLAPSKDPKDQAESAKWYEAAANVGIPRAMHNLARAYGGGFGVTRDEDKAYYWAKLALRFYSADSPNAARLRTHMFAILDARLPASTKERIADQVRAFTPHQRAIPPPRPRRVGLIAHELEVAGVTTSSHSDSP
jgi:hypothetical protein